MSRRHELEQHLRKLGEIGEIMRSMKNLALMETRKLARFLDIQDESVRLIESVAADFLQFRADLNFQSNTTTPSRLVGNAHALPKAVLVIGSERGFCGDFNEELLNGLGGQIPSGSPILAVGGKLCVRLDKQPTLAGQFDGPAVAEDVPKTLNQLIPAIGRLQKTESCQGLTVLHHRSGMEGIQIKSLLPPFTALPNPDPATLHPPLLNLPPGQFYAELVHHYLFAALHEIFYTSLMAENQRRIMHLEGAIQRLEEKNEDLARKSRTLRQEEITEEIEVILLSVEGVER